MLSKLFLAMAALAGVVCVASLAACSTDTPHVDIDRSGGGVLAHVMENLSPAQAAQLAPACLREIAQDGASVQWFKTEFRRNRMRSSVVAVAPGDMQVALSSWVEIHPQSCEDGKLYRVAKVVSMHPAP